MISSRYDDGSLRFQNMQDEEVVVYAKCGSQQATEHLLAKYRGMVESKARSYFLMGADHEDVVQEGMIGLFKAIRDFREDKLTKFRPFAELCVTRQIITAVKMATRQKHAPLNAYISLNRPLNDEDNDSTLLEIIPDESVADPAAVVVDQHQPRNLLEMLDGHLSNLEARVLECYLEGMSYREMSKVLGCRPKSIDNALQRVKRKVSILLAREDE
jgi:RNA polymerase sporulation-specific sigma factor